jgi:hypothetical protein
VGKLVPEAALPSAAASGKGAASQPVAAVAVVAVVVAPVPEPAAGKPRRGLGLLGKQAFSRATPALELRPKARASSPGRDEGLAGLIALARAGGAGTPSLGQNANPLALLRDELLGLLALTEEPPEVAPDAGPPA